MRIVLRRGHNFTFERNCPTIENVANGISYDFLRKISQLLNKYYV